MNPAAAEMEFQHDVAAGLPSDAPRSVSPPTGPPLVLRAGLKGTEVEMKAAVGSAQVVDGVRVLPVLELIYPGVLIVASAAASAVQHVAVSDARVAVAVAAAVRLVVAAVQPAVVSFQPAAVDDARVAVAAVVVPDYAVAVAVPVAFVVV